MTRSRALSSLLIVGTLSMMPGVPAASSAPSASVRLVPVSGSNPFGPECGLAIPPPFQQSEFLPPDTGGEPHIAVNPKDSMNIVTAWIQDFSVGHFVGATRDGGRTWHRVAVPGLSGCTGGDQDHQGAFDPSLTFGPNGSVYLVSMSGRVDPGATSPTNAVVVNRSTDGGFTWSPPIDVHPATGYNDHPSIAVDSNDPNRLYVVWAMLNGPLGGNGVRLALSISRDAGRTWSDRREIYTPRRFARNMSGSALTVLGDGTLVYSWGEIDSFTVPLSPLITGLGSVPRRELRLIRSHDRGATWSNPVVLGRPPRFGPQDPEDGHGVTGENTASLAAGPGTSAVAVWVERESETSSRIFLSSSPDSARSWRRPRIIRSLDTQAFLPTVAIDGTGRIGVLWYDFRNDRAGDDELTTDVWLGVSRDAGRSWREVHVAGPFDTRTAWDDPRGTFDTSFFLGDYMGLAGLPRGFAAAIVQARPKARIGQSQVFAALIEV